MTFPPCQKHGFKAVSVELTTWYLAGLGPGLDRTILLNIGWIFMELFTVILVPEHPSINPSIRTDDFFALLVLSCYVCHNLGILPFLCFDSLLTSTFSSYSCFLSLNPLYILCSAIIPDVQWCQRCLLNPSCLLSGIIQFLSFHLSTNPSTLPAIKPSLN